MACAVGGPGSGASSAGTAQFFAAPMSLRLDWINAPTVRLGSDPAASGSQFGIGGNVVHTVDGRTGTLAVSLFGPAFLAVPMALPPIAGRLLVQGDVLDAAVVPSNGHVRRTFSIPNDTTIVGLHVIFQSVTFDALLGEAQFTNGADCLINR
jgi:hypothetical protein